MTTVQTKMPINWGGANPLIDNKIRVEIKEISRNSENIVYQITDTPIIENVFEDEVYTTDHIIIRNKTMVVTAEQHDTLFQNADTYINAYYPDATIFEKEQLRPNVALLLYVQNDLLDNGKCIYNTEPNQWEL